MPLEVTNTSPPACRTGYILSSMEDTGWVDGAPRPAVPPVRCHATYKSCLEGQTQNGYNLISKEHILTTF